MTDAADAVLRAFADLPRSTFPQAPKPAAEEDRRRLALFEDC